MLGRKVGWYFVSKGGSFFQPDVFLNNYMFYEKMINSTFIVYDSLLESSGAACPIRAFKLSNEWLSNVFRDENNQIVVNPAM